MSKHSLQTELISTRSSRQLLDMMRDGPHPHDLLRWGVDEQEWDSAVQYAMQEVQDWERDPIAAAKADAWGQYDEQ